jgi:hypothetical protein
MWWYDQEEKEIQYDAQYWAAKATLHQAHVRAYDDMRLDKKWEALGFRRVTNWGCPREELKVQPMFKPIPELPILRFIQLPVGL